MPTHSSYTCCSTSIEDGVTLGRFGFSSHSQGRVLRMVGLPWNPLHKLPWSRLVSLVCSSVVALSGNQVVTLRVISRKNTENLGTDHYVTTAGRASIDGAGRFLFMGNTVVNAASAIASITNQFTTTESGVTGSTIWNRRLYNVTRIQMNR